jgi:hypothetical protein
MRNVILGLAMLSALLVSCTKESPLAQSTAEQVPTDWDLYMLRLINRARTDPTAEDFRQGTNYGESVAPPLAYSTILGRAAQNHTEWMGANRNNPRLDTSYDHHETLNGAPDGPLP